MTPVVHSRTATSVAGSNDGGGNDGDYRSAGSRTVDTPPDRRRAFEPPVPPFRATSVGGGPPGLGGGDPGDDGIDGSGRPPSRGEGSPRTNILKALADALRLPSTGGGKDFTLPALPAVHAFLGWRDQVETDVTRESRAGEEGFRWILQVRNGDLLFADFRDSGRFPTSTSASPAPSSALSPANLAVK